jgi:hypothetical protein
MDENRIDPGHAELRNTFRVVGPILLVIGGVFMAVGLVDFFGAFGGRHSPRFFWCLFLGMPFLFAGGVMMRFGYMGRIMRYMSQEIAPPAKDTFNYMADGTKDGIKTVAGAVAEGLRQGSTVAGSQAGVRCQHCNTMNSGDARFCIHCGQALIKSRMCPNCNELNDPHANFCANCGHAFK